MIQELNRKLEHFTTPELYNLLNAFNLVCTKPLEILRETHSDFKFNKAQIAGMMIIMTFLKDLVEEINLRLDEYPENNK